IGIGAVCVGLLFVSFLFVSIVSKGYTAFWQTQIRLDIHFDAAVIDPSGNRDLTELGHADYASLIKQSLRKRFPEVKNRREKRTLYKLVSSGAAFDLRARVLADPDLIGTRQTLWLLADDDLDMLVKGQIDRSLPENERRLKDQVIGWIDALSAQGAVELKFNSTFFTNGDSREPEQAGIGGALMGSLYTLLITLLLAFPIGVATSVYLEEFAPRNCWTDL
ncbi:phosphate ABC transporter permease, partial [Candidatus Endoriftia persephone str. Guaymas]|nr:phosphate ABC transporter permease [Candidatus Endoriftia persephone str. Guaymas]